MKKIYIPFKGNDKLGGPFTFMRNLRVEFDKQNVAYQSTPLFAKGIFFPISYGLKHIKLTKLFGGKVIQRLDGVHYPSKHGDEYIAKNNEMKNIYQNYADYVVFQSEYSKKQVFEMFGAFPEGKYSLIYNGANTDIFYPAKGKKIHKKVRFITTGRFRNKDMLVPVIKALDELERKGFNFELNIFGPILLEEKDEILSRKYVINSQSMNQEVISDALRKSDIFIYSHLNPPCPNSVIEAISCALPIVGFDSGAMKELCFFNGELFADVNDDRVFQEYESFDYKKLEEKLELSISNFDELKKRSLDNAKNYSMEKCAAEYAGVLVNIKPGKSNYIKVIVFLVDHVVSKIVKVFKR